MKPSGIITLTTDFGLSDPYVAMMKGVILSINPSARLSMSPIRSEQADLSALWSSAKRSLLP